MTRCGCHVADGAQITYCPLHASAQELLDALRMLRPSIVAARQNVEPVRKGGSQRAYDSFTADLRLIERVEDLAEGR